MKQNLYQELFDHVAFPVFAVDKNGFVCYKNPQTAKYQKMIRKRAKVERHFRASDEENMVFLIGNTPYVNGVRLSDGDVSLYLFLTRFQYPDGRRIMKQMLGAYGTSAEDFVFSLKNTHGEAPADVRRFYEDILLFTDQEETDLGIALYALQDILMPLFEKLRALSVLGYRISAQIDESFEAKYPVRLSSSDLLHRLFHLLYFMLKISESKSVSLTLSGERDAHVLCVKTQTAQEPIACKNEGCVPYFSEVMPECESEFRLLQGFRAFSEQTEFQVSENGFAVLRHRIPYEKVPAGFALHSRLGFTRFEKDARAFIKALEKRIHGSI